MGPEENKGLRSLSLGIKKKSRSLERRGKGEAQNDLRGHLEPGCVDLEDSRTSVIALHQLLLSSSHFQKADVIKPRHSCLGAFSQSLLTLLRRKDLLELFRAVAPNPECRSEPCGRV